MPTLLDIAGHWMPPSRRAPPWLRLWLAVVVIGSCAVIGLGARCHRPSDPVLVVLLAELALQGVSALASFALVVVACVRGQWRRAGVELFVGVCMLLVMPLAICVFITSMPVCRALPGGG